MHLQLSKSAAFVSLFLLPLGLALAQDQVYRCIDKDGKSTFQSQVCPGAALPASAAVARPIPASAAPPIHKPPIVGIGPLEYPEAPTPQEVKAAAMYEARQKGRSADMPEAKQWGSGADVIVVSGYGSAALTQVNISHTARPVLLVLTTYDRTRWKVVPSPGTRIKAVLVSAYGFVEKDDVQLPSQAPVLVDTLPHTDAVENIRFRELLGKLKTRYGVERVLAFRGAHTLPPVVQVSGPFVPDPHLTLDGVRPEVASSHFSFNLVSIDGRRLPFTNTGPKDGNRYTGIVRGGTLSSPQAGPAALGADGREAYYLEGNGSTLVWAPEGMNGRTVKVKFPSNLPPLSWGSGLAWDTRKGVLLIVSFGGEGHLYRFDTRNHEWLDSHSLRDRDFTSVAFNSTTGEYVAISNQVELVRFNERGELLDVLPMAKLLPDVDSTYDKGNQRLESLIVATEGEATALLNVRNGTVTHIWTYDQRSRKAQLTYKVVD